MTKMTLSKCIVAQSTNCEQSSDRLRIWNVGFCVKGKTGVAGKKPLGAKDEN